MVQLPSGEASILELFYGGVGGSSWANSVTQYCQGVAEELCSARAQVRPPAIRRACSAAPGMTTPGCAVASDTVADCSRGGECRRALRQYNCCSNTSVQYVIATATKNNSSGFGSQYCAYHSSTTATWGGNVAYTNLPYMTDAGASCGANFNGLGPTAGITIVGGHELAETMTDQFPLTGWADSSGEEIGDKCAWISSGQGAAADIKLLTGTFAVQSLWSNAFNSDAGGCVLSY